MADQPEPTITGQIQDSSGGAIPRARVLIHWDPAGSGVGLSDNIGIKQDLIVTSDADGKFSANVPSGFYDLFVSAMAFTPEARKVRVKQQKTTNLRFSLKADPLVLRELADDMAFLKN
jgi:hypothetical protein